MKLTEGEVLDKIERMHVYEGHDYPVIRILVDDGSGEHIPEDEYEQVLKKFREWKKEAKIFHQIISGSNGIMTTIAEVSEWKEIVELLKKRREFYKKDLHECNKKGLFGTSVHYNAIIEELNLISGHIHKWKYVKRWKFCDCGILREMSDKEFEKISGGEK
ncbi:hypothetical protein LCGC14_2849530 [marine sediment metagenome]|uniref:Uncharacterized protein n=1 Tax=marine sediment metagenome TaxID=412755 RepID=A0A0F8YVJ2_9ZZZZ|nr:hypothetical protein [bacterium]